MRIIIDVRALMHGNVSGVTVYVKEFLAELSVRTSPHEFILFYNSFRDVSRCFESPDFIRGTSHIRIVYTRIPNILLNFLLRFFHRPYLDVLISLTLKPQTNTKRCVILLQLLDIVKAFFTKYTALHESIDIFFMPDPRPVALSSHVKLVTTFHDLSFEYCRASFSLKTRLWHKLLKPRALAKHSDRIIAVSKLTKRTLHDTYGIDNEKIHVVYHGVNVSYFNNVSESKWQAIREKYKIPEKYFFFLSTLEPRKNIHRLIDAFKIFHAHYPNIVLVIAGVFHHAIFSMPSLPVSPGIHYPGFIEEKDKPILYQRALGFIYVSEYEGFGLPVLEALASGCPVVIPRESAMSEIAPAGAIRVDPLSSQSIETGLEQLLQVTSDSKFKQGLRDYARSFTWKKTVDETLHLFFSF